MLLKLISQILGLMESSIGRICWRVGACSWIHVKSFEGTIEEWAKVWLPDVRFVQKTASELEMVGDPAVTERVITIMLADQYWDLKDPRHRTVAKSNQSGDTEKAAAILPSYNFREDDLAIDGIALWPAAQ
jgi:hypothetical protein